MKKSGWFDYIEGYSKKIYPIYINPSSKDYIRMKKENGTNIVRYIIDFKKLNLYVFDSDIDHFKASFYLEKNKNIYKKDLDKLEQTEAFSKKLNANILLPIWGDFGLGISKVNKGKLKIVPGILFYLSYVKNKKLFDFMNNFFVEVLNFECFNDEDLNELREEWLLHTDDLSIYEKAEGII